MSGYWYSSYGKTDGTEFVDVLLERDMIDQKRAEMLKDELTQAHTSVSRLKCERCGKEILSIFDEYNQQQWWGYLGNQASKTNVYRYSTIIKVLRMLGGVLDANDESKIYFNTWPDNSLYNVHSRIHTWPVKDYSWICRQNSIWMLCNECFRKTYRRVKVYENEGSGLFRNGVKRLEVSVVPELDETIESVLKATGIDMNKVWWEV